MKLNNIIYPILSLFLVFACNPMEDIEKELEEAEKAANEVIVENKDKDIAPSAYELVDKDYEKSSNESVKTNKRFSAEATAEDNLPDLLGKLFLAKKVGDATTITYKEYLPSSTTDGPSKADKELSDNDYKVLLGFQYTNFNDLDDAKGRIAKLSDLVFHTTQFTQQVIEFKYTGNIVRYGKWVLNGETWEQEFEAYAGSSKAVVTSEAYQITNDDYDSFGGDPKKYHNFDSGDKATKHLPGFLKAKYADATDGTVKYVKYIYRDYSNVGRLTVERENSDSNWMLSEIDHVWNFDQAKWVEYKKEQIVMMSGTYSFTEDKTWGFVAPIQLRLTSEASTETYELTAADYTLVGDGQYKNFTSDTPTEDVAVHDKIILILKSRFTDIEPGDVFAVTFKYYNGSVNTMELNFEAY